MSAGGISYSGITNYGKVTLPSVEAGFGSMNILRDPPKSIMTRRIDKVGETSSITEMIDLSENRACEAISTYARGVNPMVSVSYGNEGNNGGQRVSGCGKGSHNLSIGNGKLPYRIMDNGAFRPPILRQENLLPLSRLPRTNTTAFTKPGFVDFTKKLMCPGREKRYIKQKTLKACIRPTATYRLDAPLVEPFEVKYVIKNPVKYDKGAGISGYRTQDLTQQVVIDPTKEVNNNPLHTNAIINKRGENMIYADNSHLNTNKYTQNILHSNVQSKKSRDIMVGDIEDAIDINTNKYTQDMLHSNVQSKKSRDIMVGDIEDAIDINPDKYLQSTLHSNIQSKKSQSIMVGDIEDAIDINPDKYLQSTLHINAKTNKNQNIQVTPIDDIMDIDIQTKDNFNISYTAPMSGNTKDDFIHDDMELQRRILLAEASTNKQQNIYSRPQIEHQSIQIRNRPIVTANTNRGTIQRQSIDTLTARDYKLKPTINAGGFTGRAQKPLQGQNSEITINSDRNIMSKKVLEMQTARFLK